MLISIVTYGGLNPLNRGVIEVGKNPLKVLGIWNSIKMNPLSLKRIWKVNYFNKCH